MAPVVLPPDVERALIASKKQIEEAEHEIARAERIGLDVSTHKDAISKARQMRDNILAEYGRNAVKAK